jgi:hypothetical protein
MSKKLRAILDEAVEENGCRLDALTVLGDDRDPYRADTPAKRRDAEWIAEQVARFAPDRRIHIRGLHYLVVAAGNVKKPNGRLYQNTEKDFVWFNEACCHARWLRLVQISQIVDQRNDDPWLPPKPEDAVESKLDVIPLEDIPDTEALMPYFTQPTPTVQQPYRLVIFGEKSSLREDLLPVAREFGAELILLTGENSITRIFEMLVRTSQDKRPTRAFYFSDFDPSGMQMPVSTARKIQALRDEYLPNLDLVLYKVALSEDQVHQYNLPHTPLKEKDARAPDWRNRFDRDATEIDALIALHPGVLERLARDALSPFFDDDLSDRTETALKDWRIEAESAIEGHDGYDDTLAEIEAAREKLEAAAEEMTQVQNAALARFADLDPPELNVEEPDLDDEPEPTVVIFTTEEDYATSSRRMIATKRYLDYDPDDDDDFDQDEDE